MFVLLQTNGMVVIVHDVIWKLMCSSLSSSRCFWKFVFACCFEIFFSYLSECLLPHHTLKFLKLVATSLTVYEPVGKGQNGGVELSVSRPPSGGTGRLEAHEHTVMVRVRKMVDGGLRRFGHDVW